MVQLLSARSGGRSALLRGVRQMARLVQPTLGPVPRTVAITRLLSADPPEVLDHAATIARRTLQLTDPFEDMGAMLVRHAMWRVFERTGDGAATTAVLITAMLTRAVRLAEAGVDPVALRQGIEQASRTVLQQLVGQSRPIELPEDIAGLVRATLRDAAVADMIGQVVDAVGSDGSIVVENAHGSHTECEYFDGLRWDEGYVSSFLLRPGESSLRILDPRIFVTTHHLERAEQLVPALEACVAAGARSLFVIAPEVRDSAVGLLVVNRERDVLDGAIAVRAPSYGENRSRILEDVAALTGGRCVDQDRGDRLSDITPVDLGRARQAWATSSAFAILGGWSDSVAVRRRIDEARAQMSARRHNDVEREQLEQRIGRLVGTAAAIRVGAPTQAEQEDLKLRVQSAVRVARAALRSGVVAGGGAALLACTPEVVEYASSLEGDQRLGARVLADTLSAPMCAILRNGGLEPSRLVDEARRRGLPWVFDVLQQRWVDAWTAGLLEPLDVLLAAVETAASVVASAITADVLIHHPNQTVEYEP